MNPRNIFSLARKAQLTRAMSSKLAQGFSGAAHHHDSHGHAPAGHAEVHLERVKNLVANTSFNGDLVAVFGFKDANAHSHHDETDPYHHLRHAPTFSFDRFYFADPYHHDDGAEGLMNEPHGYLTNDDPMDIRPNYERPLLELLFLFTAGVCLTLTLGYQGLNLGNPAENLFNMNTAAEELEDKIRQVRIENNNLLQKKEQLETELASL